MSRSSLRDMKQDQMWSDYVLSSGHYGSAKVGNLLANHLAKRTAIYAVGREYLPPIKIGFSRKPRARLHELQIGSPEELRFHLVCWLSTTENATQLEATCHRFLKERGCHVRGEWFDLDPKGARLAVDAMAAHLGCQLVPHQKLTSTFTQSKDPLAGFFWQ